jgi:uncharacterized membrane protein (DUF4010 family)
MNAFPGLALHLAVALGIGLLIGAERERRKGEGPSRSSAGIRTFAVASLSGAVSIVLGGPLLLAVTFFAFLLLAVVAYLRTQPQDPGLTSETALGLTVLLGGLAVQEPIIASGLAVTVSILLATKDRIHHFVSSVLSEAELEDALIFGAAALVIYPLTPDRNLGPYGALNPHTIWKIVLLVMSISAFGYIAVRLLGPRVGLPLAGLASGFVSSAATIGSFGARAKNSPGLMRPAVAGAALSTIATVLEMAILLAATSPPTLSRLKVSLIAAGLGAGVYGTLFTVKTMRKEVQGSLKEGRAFSLKSAVLFTATFCVVLLASAALNTWFGKSGVMIAASLAGFADTHSPAVAVASLVAAGKLGTEQAILPVLAALSANTITKISLAIASGGQRFAAQLIPGLVLVIVLAWVGALHLILR